MTSIDSHYLLNLDSMIDRVRQFCKPLSTGLCNNPLAFGNLPHDGAYYLTLIF